MLHGTDWLCRAAGLILLVAVPRAQSLLAAPGDLDPTFNEGGKTTTFFLNDRESDRAYPRAIALQPDGKLVVAGHALLNATGNDFALARYNTDGSLDAAFGAGGIVRTDFFGLTDQAGGVAIQPDGKIIAGGGATIGFIGNSADSAFALARYNPDGSLDASFGEGGATFTDFNGLGDRILWAALQPDGKVVVAGVAFSPTSDADFALARYSADGKLDPTFSGDGKVTTDFGRNFEDYGYSVAIAPDGKIVAAGWATNGPDIGGKTDTAVARYRPDGTLDSSFDGDGRWTDDIGGANDNDRARAVAVQRNGKIVVAGVSHEIHITGYTHTDFSILRLNDNGSYDGSFGSGGQVFTDFGEFDPPGPSGDSAEAIRILPDGRIVAAGTANFYRYRFDFAIARYLGDPVTDAAAAGLTITSTGMRAGGAVILEGRATLDSPVAIEVSSDLSPGSFVPHAQVSADASGVWRFQENAAASSTRRFYRAALPAPVSGGPMRADSR